jgi:hypothetical protein
LNDPFGRVSRRQRQAYRLFREQLREQGVTTTPAVGVAQQHLRRTGLRLLVIIIGAAIVMGILFPTLRTPIAVTASLLLLWVLSSYLQTRNHLTTYARELNGAGSRDARQHADPSNREDDPP